MQDNCFINVPCCPLGNNVLLEWTIELSNGAIVDCVAEVILPECDNEPCAGTDSDGDGICDEEDCWPNDATQTYSIGDPCDDGDPMTTGDVYNSDCECAGNPILEPCNGTDSDGDGVCDDDDCFLSNPNMAHGPGDPCDDGDPTTVNDTYDANCICSGEPNNNCQGVDPDEMADGHPDLQSFLHYMKKVEKFSS